MSPDGQKADCRQPLDTQFGGAVIALAAQIQWSMQSQHRQQADDLAEFLLSNELGEDSFPSWASQNGLRSEAECVQADSAPYCEAMLGVLAL